MSRKKKVAIIVGTVIVAAAAVIAGVFVWKGRAGGNGDSQDKVYVEKVAHVMSQNSGVTNRYSGVVEPQEMLEVKKDAEREVKEVFVSVGDEVEEGTVLFSYDTEDMQLQLDQMKLDLEGIGNEISNYNAQIAELQQEKATMPADQQFEYTTQIQTLQTSIKQAEFSRTSKQTEIEKLQTSINNSEVKSTMAGVVKTINESGMDEYGNMTAYMTILATGEYRVKGSMDETSVGMLMEGTPVILRSRTDDTMTWKGTVTKIDTDPTEQNNNEMMGMEGGEIASKYAFYVSLDTADGLLLGQHLYVEPDYGQSEAVEKEGIWLGSWYIDRSGDEPFVWVADKKDRLRKRTVELGEYDENMDEYEIVSGLSEEDYIAFPMPGLYEGVKTVTEESEVDYSSPLYNQESGDDMIDDGMMDDGMVDDGMMMEEGFYDTEVVEEDFGFGTEVAE